MDFKDANHARRFFNAVPREQRAIVDGVLYLVRGTCGAEVALEPVTVYGVPLRDDAL